MSKAANNMNDKSSPQTHTLWRRRLAFITFFVAVVGVVWFIKNRTDLGKTLGENPVKVGRFYDWNWSQEPSTTSLRTLVCERLGEMGPGQRFILRLAREAKFLEVEKNKSHKKVQNATEPPIASITLKDGVYWSDGAQLIAKHVVDAFERTKDGANRTLWTPPNSVHDTWLRTLKLSAADKLTVKVEGLKDQKDLETFLASDIVLPIRLDLLVPPLVNPEDKNSERVMPERADAAGYDDRAWLVTIGRYRLKALPAASLLLSKPLVLEPNPMYYRGPAAAETTMPLTVASKKP